MKGELSEGIKTPGEFHLSCMMRVTRKKDWGSWLTWITIEMTLFLIFLFYLLSSSFLTGPFCYQDSSKFDPLAAQLGVCSVLPGNRRIAYSAACLVTLFSGLQVGYLNRISWGFCIANPFCFSNCVTRFTTCNVIIVVQLSVLFRDFASCQNY